MAGPQGSSSTPTPPPSEQPPAHANGGAAQARPPASDPEGAAGALVLTRDKSPKTSLEGCPNPVLGRRFILSTGELVPIPCNRSTCSYCSRRSAMITAAMVGLDAEYGGVPRVVSTFTTRDRVGPQTLREASRSIMRQIRAEFGPVEYCHFLEFTTGLSSRSGGRRRPHLHTLWKGLEPDAGPLVSAIASHVLERLAGAYRQEVEEIRTPGGAMHYVASHHMKESQAPPVTWGPTRRVRASRGYWAMPGGAKRTRELATNKIRERRTAARLEAALLDEGCPDHELDRAVFILLGEALSEPPPRVVQFCKPWEDPLGS